MKGQAGGGCTKRNEDRGREGKGGGRMNGWKKRMSGKMNAQKKGQKYKKLQ